MRADLPVSGLTDQDLRAIAEMAAEQSVCIGAPESWCRFWSELSESLRSEQARRTVEAARRRDPLGLVWFGRLD